MTDAIRRALPADLPAISELGARTFTQTFGHLYPPEHLQAYLATAYSLERTASDLADPARALWVATQDGRPVGYALAGPSELPHPDVGPDAGEVKRLYLLREAQNRGLGTRLLREVIAWLDRDGPRDLWVSVYEDNHGAQRLYGRHGFVQVGEWGFEVGGSVDRDLILRRPGPDPAR